MSKEILDLSDDDLLKHVEGLNTQITELKARVSDLEDELEDSTDEYLELENKYETEFHRCDECVMPNCKSMALVVELESVISTFKREHKVG